MKLPLLRFSRITNADDDPSSRLGVQLWFFPLKFDFYFKRFERVLTVPPSKPPVVIVAVGRFSLWVSVLPYTFRAAVSS